jgi:hypothetical protein
MRNGKVPSAQEVFQCKTYTDLISLIKKEYGLSTFPLDTWSMDLDDYTYGTMRNHIFRLVEKHIGTDKR